MRFRPSRFVTKAKSNYGPKFVLDISYAFSSLPLRLKVKYNSGPKFVQDFSYTFSALVCVRGPRIRSGASASAGTSKGTKNY